MVRPTLDCGLDMVDKDGSEFATIGTRIVPKNGYIPSPVFPPTDLSAAALGLSRPFAPVLPLLIREVGVACICVSPTPFGGFWLSPEPPRGLSFLLSPLRVFGALLGRPLALELAADAKVGVGH